MSYMSLIVDSIGGSWDGTGDRVVGSMNLGHISSTVRGRHLLRENETKCPQQPLEQSSSSAHG